MDMAAYLKSLDSYVNVRKLLRRWWTRPSEFAVVPTGKDLGNWWLRPVGPWLEVELRYEDSDKCDVEQARYVARCFCRKVDEVYVVSDCGKTVSFVAKTRGCESEVAWCLVKRVCGDAFFQDGFVVCRVSARTLREVIVRVVAAAVRARQLASTRDESVEAAS